MRRVLIADLLGGSHPSKQVTVMGWVRTFRAKRFIALNDGSTINNLQCVVDFSRTSTKVLDLITTGAALKLDGVLIESIGREQAIELQVEHIELIGASNPTTYPIQPKKHSLAFLREKAHLRIRTTTFLAVMRVRAALAFAVHNFFNLNGFYYIQTPIITAENAEGAGEAFRVMTKTSPESAKLPNKEEYGDSFFGKPTMLTVSGQLQAESYALGMGKVYTFGPTFRAENSNTGRHLAEFWMIEPEMAFFDLKETIGLAENFITYVLRYIMENNGNDLDFLDKRQFEEEKTKPQAQRSTMRLLEKIAFVINNKLQVISYSEAFEILKQSGANRKKKFNATLTQWGCDLQSEHERFLVEKHFQCPVAVTDYPKDIKAFYMRLNEDNKTVRAMDILFPNIGEVVGGSQREERLDILQQQMKMHNINPKNMEWYVDLRRFGTTPHSGFGLGFERLTQFVTGMANIRDVIPYPRTPLHANF